MMEIKSYKISRYEYEKYAWLIKYKNDIIGFCPIKDNDYKLLKVAETSKQPHSFTYINCKDYYDKKSSLNINNESLKNKIDEYFITVIETHPEVEYI